MIWKPWFVNDEPNLKDYIKKVKLCDMWCAWRLISGESFQNKGTNRQKKLKLVSIQTFYKDHTVTNFQGNSKTNPLKIIKLFFISLMNIHRSILMYRNDWNSQHEVNLWRSNR